MLLNKVKVIILAITLLFAFIPIYLISADNGNLENRIEIVKKCLIGSDISKLNNGGNSAEFDIESFIYLSDTLNKSSKEQDKRNICAVEALGLPKNSYEVEIIMKSLINAAKSDKNVQVACHEIGHELGMRTWRELGKDGLVMGLELCTYGFYHGYMRAAIESDGGEERIPFLVDFCKKQAYTKPITAEPDQYNFARFDFCAHGVGHAIGTADWTLERSVDLCNNFPISYYIDPSMGFRNGGAAGWCATGVFNEKFYYPWGKELLTLKDKMDTCNPIDEVFQIHCAQYVTSNSYLTIDEIKKGCKLYQGATAAGCYQGAMQSIIRKILFPSGENKGLDYYTNPERGAQLVDEVCGDDLSGNCGKQFAADSLSTVQSLKLVKDVCLLIKNNKLHDKCLWQVETLENEGFKYVDN